MGVTTCPDLRKEIIQQLHHQLFLLFLISKEKKSTFEPIETLLVLIELCIFWNNLVTAFFNAVKFAAALDRYHLFCHLVIVVVSHVLPFEMVMAVVRLSSGSRQAVVRHSSSSFYCSDSRQN
jgi:hypothetical protein